MQARSGKAKLVCNSSDLARTRSSFLRCPGLQDHTRLIPTTSLGQTSEVDMEGVFVIGVGCVAWTAIELFRMSSTSVTIAMPATSRSMHTRPQAAPRAPAQSPNHAARPSRTPRFTAWDDRGRPVTVEDLGRA
jgi:hypothetical protein